MNFFDLLRKVVFFGKKDSAGEINNEELQQFVPYMMNRWMSFYDKNKAVFVNETFNRFTGLFDDKRESYMLYYNLALKSKFKKIEYVKKQKEKKEKEDVSIAIIAKNNYISQREVNLYMDLFEQSNK